MLTTLFRRYFNSILLNQSSWHIMHRNKSYWTVMKTCQHRIMMPDSWVNYWWRQDYLNGLKINQQSIDYFLRHPSQWMVLCIIQFNYWRLLINFDDIPILYLFFNLQLISNKNHNILCLLIIFLAATMGQQRFEV
jgi:hypothetical protein